MAKLSMTVDKIESTDNKVTSVSGGGYLLNDSGYPTLRTLIDMIYPIGSICIRGDSTNPADIFIGTEWTRIKGRFIYGIDDNESVGITGGEREHTLTVDEMPSHQHRVKLPDGGNQAVSGFVWNYSTESRDYLGTDLAQPTGGNEPHNNMPPYKGYYIWERVL